MALATWWCDGLLPNLVPLPSFSVYFSTDAQLIARLANLSLQEVDSRFQSGSRLYLACIDEILVAYGWVATQRGDMPEFQLSFKLSERNCYLWDFRTLPAWRGRGIYPRLLQAIIRQEALFFDRFWIGTASGNTAAEHSIVKAGFHFVADLNISAEGCACGMTLLEDSEYARACATLFNLPIVL